LLVNSYDGELGLYEQSVDTGRKLVQRWLYKHGDRLPVDHEEYDATMERHSNDKQDDAEDDGAESDATACSDSVHSSSEDEYDTSEHESDSDED
jgi:hypothetical protein